jgi:hypothetical protein
VRVRERPSILPVSARYVDDGYWVETTSNDVLDWLAREMPDRLAITDGRVRLGHHEYYRRASGRGPISSRSDAAPVMSSRPSSMLKTIHAIGDRT